MADYTVAATEAGAWEKTLAASTVDTVTFTDGSGHLELLNEGSVGIYATVDGTEPTVGSNAAIYVPPASVRTIDFLDAAAGEDVLVKLISSGTPKYSVTEI